MVIDQKRVPRMAAVTGWLVSGYGWSGSRDDSTAAPRRWGWMPCRVCRFDWTRRGAFLVPCERRQHASTSRPSSSTA